VHQVTRAASNDTGTAFDGGLLIGNKPRIAGSEGISRCFGPWSELAHLFLNRYRNRPFMKGRFRPLNPYLKRIAGCQDRWTGERELLRFAFLMLQIASFCNPRRNPGTPQNPATSSIRRPGRERFGFC
jgi:hypothetical protein